MNHLTVLGVTPGMTAVDAGKAAWRAVLRFHPDKALLRNPGDEQAHNRFVYLMQTIDVLKGPSDAHRRAARIEMPAEIHWQRRPRKGIHLRRRHLDLNRIWRPKHPLKLC